MAATSEVVVASEPERVDGTVYWALIGELRKRVEQGLLQVAAEPTASEPPTGFRRCSYVGPSDEYQLALVVAALETPGFLTDSGRVTLELMRAELEFDIAEAERERAAQEIAEQRHRDAVSAYAAQPWWRRWRTSRPQA